MPWPPRPSLSALKNPSNHIVKGLAAFEGVKGRFQNIPLEEDILLIDDAYNANPSAFEAALHSACPWCRKKDDCLWGWAICWNWERPPSLPTGRQAAGSPIGRFVVLRHGNPCGRHEKGAMAAGMPSNRIIIAKTHDELTDNHNSENRTKDVILLKGSRKMQFEKVSEGLEEAFRITVWEFCKDEFYFWETGRKA
jgi:UDP-N-acetylmuramoyl-tripeptide--D-alanyl-D-alanine ligase